MRWRTSPDTLKAARRTFVGCERAAAAAKSGRIRRSQPATKMGAPPKLRQGGKPRTPMGLSQIEHEKRRPGTARPSFTLFRLRRSRSLRLRRRFVGRARDTHAHQHVTEASLQQVKHVHSLSPVRARTMRSRSARRRLLVRILPRLFRLHGIVGRRLMKQRQRRRRQRLVGVGQKQAHLPNLSIRQYSLVRRHSREP